MATNRIHESDLRDLCATINRLTGNPTEIDGYKVGQYILSSAYGGHKLEQVVNTSGGVTSITSGYVSRRELYNQMQAIITGLTMNR